MRIPIISSNKDLFDDISSAFKELNEELMAEEVVERPDYYKVVHLADSQAAIEHINYQTPELIVIDFSSDTIEAFAVMDKIIADPWLNHGGIVALFDDVDIENKINELANSNIIISVSHRDISGLFPKVLRVIHNNQQILFQRAIQIDFISNVSGRYELDLDLSIIPCYANLIANYLYNIGFVDSDTKSKIGLTLVELLINAIEHGTCGITTDEKTKYMEENGSIHGLIAERRQAPELLGKKVMFEYDINRQSSTYRIKDEGAGFDWRQYLDPAAELDLLSSHGRGILLSAGSVSRLQYNDRGNEVTVAVDHRQNTTNTVPSVFRDREVVVFQPGDWVFREGEESDFLYYIAEGEFRVEVEGKQVATVTPADILMGEMSILLQETRSANVIANTPGKLIKISSAALINSIKDQPYYGLFLAKLLAQRLYDVHHYMVR